MLARFALLAAVVATLAVAGPVVKGSSRSLSADVRGRTKVVFFGDSGIYVANVDGTGLRRLTRRPDQDPVWSPDGSRIAFERCCYSVWAMKADGSSPRRLSRNGTDPAWSPDSSWIAFADLAAHLYVVRPDGRGLREVAHDAKAFGFAWSPDSTTLVYSDGDRFHLVDVRSGSRSTLPTAPAQGPWRPAWSPDGARIAFLSGDDNFLYVMPAAGGAARKLAKGEGVSGDTPAWSPDGSSILFMNNGDFRVIHPDGTGETQLSRTKDAGTPAWSPDGALISYQRERTRGLFEPGHDIWVARADGSGAAPVTRAFPDGIDYQGPQIANGTVAARPLARLALVSLPPSRRLISLHTVLASPQTGLGLPLTPAPSSTRA